MHRILLTLTAVLAMCGCSREPQRGPIAKVREKVAGYGDNEAEYEFYLNRKGQKVAHGDITVFYGKSNKVLFRGKNKDDMRHGKWVEYDKAGKKKGAVSFKNGMVDGDFKAWYPNGQLKVKGQNAKGVQVGEWVYYGEDGKVAKKEIWKDGKKLSTLKGDSDPTVKIPVPAAKPKTKEAAGPTPEEVKTPAPKNEGTKPATAKESVPQDTQKTATPK